MENLGGNQTAAAAQALEAEKKRQEVADHLNQTHKLTITGNILTGQIEVTGSSPMFEVAWGLLKMAEGQIVRTERQGLQPKSKPAIQIAHGHVPRNERR